MTTDGRTDGRTDGQRHNIIRPVFRRAYKNSKAARPENIRAEAIKADTEFAVTILHNLFNKIWEMEKVPAQWKEGHVIKLPKKETSRTAATIAASYSCQCHVGFSTKSFRRE
jgi:hypothetical protein